MMPLPYDDLLQPVTMRWWFSSTEVVTARTHQRGHARQIEALGQGIDEVLIGHVFAGVTALRAGAVDSVGVTVGQRDA